jgi:hypothetical protein
MARRIVTLSLVVLIAAASGYALHRATESGIGMTADSIRYLNVADNLRNGSGFVIARGKYDQPMTHFAPGYPLVLAGLAATLRADPDEVARWLHVILLPINVMLIARLAWLATRRSALLTIVAAIASAASVAMIETHRAALSEGLYICCALLSAAMLLEFLQRDRWRWLIAAAACVGAAILARYAGVSLLLGGIVLILWVRDGVAGRRRITQAAIFSAIALALPIVWIFRNVLAAHNAVNRSLDVHLVSERHINTAVTTLASWLFPNSIPANLSAALLGVIFSVAVVGYYRYRYGIADCVDAVSRSERRAVIVSAVLALAYMVVLTLSISLVDFYTPLDTRILSPLYPLALVLALWLFRLAVRQERALPRVASVAAGLLLVAGQVLHGSSVYKLTREQGSGFSNKRWAHSKLLARLATLPPDVNVYSNAPDVIDLMTDRDSVSLPAQFDSTTGDVVASFEEDMQRFRARFRADEGAVLVYFRRVKRAYLPSEGYLRKRIVLRSVYNTAEGAIYRRAALSKR